MAAPSLQSFCLPWLLLVLLFMALFASASALPKTIPRLGVLRGELNPEKSEAALASEDLETYYYDQTLDHFNYKPESYAIFKQRYMVSYKHWHGAHVAAPIFAYLGEESSVDDDVKGIGFLSDNAARFGALIVYIEHRYYGKSVPFGGFQNETLKNATERGYFNSAQALADYAEVLTYLKQKLSAEASPIIVIGGSYGGMLASWFRLKYPHIALGALASSAPILYFDGVTPAEAYYDVVTKDFRETSESCYNTIKMSWSEIDRVAAKQDGLSILSKKFKACKPLDSASALKNYLDNMYTGAAQYDRPPRYPVTVVCSGIDGETTEGSDLLDKIAAGMFAYRGEKDCYQLQDFFPSETRLGWNWQVCSDIVIPIGVGNDTMFPPSPFNMTDNTEYCKEKYGVTPRPHWVTTYYGGQNIKQVLRRFASNIIFSNGLRDPYSSGGVLEDISHTVVAVSTKQGSHCLDILPARKEEDPEWLVMQRNIELEIINGWILKYYEDLLKELERN
ncbi:lysosomal Pro-X carboxypeptidase [Tripterygium wilfordii]|uniref:Lysosomal Pro-X carboxypeptidase n=1 Tax=Tripterygium wilfordii TaxID=458696 RepID=A0A7J7C5M9_TRIWF|nr:lysosomal Pro-X carboxypeptidase-like [Tripterygium wilfordii]KAF5729444.1 lysosomal Pro-X carboxypeptidase [Tripterygium wilfordii]